MSFGHGHYWHAFYCWAGKKVLQTYITLEPPNCHPYPYAHNIQQTTPPRDYTTNGARMQCLVIMNSSVCNLCDQKFPCGLTENILSGLDIVYTYIRVFGCEIWILIVTVCCAALIHEAVVHYAWDKDLNQMKKK